MTVYFPTSDTDAPFGGIRTLYAAVDALNASGQEAAIVHLRRGFRVKWFDNETRVVAGPDVVLKPERDIVVVTEFRAAALLPVVGPGVPKILFDQAPYLTFRDTQVPPSEAELSPFRDPHLLGCLTVSLDGKELLSQVWPWLSVHRIRPRIVDLATPDALHRRRKRLIALTLRKRPVEARLLLALLAAHIHSCDWSIVVLEGLDARGVAQQLEEAAIFVHLPATPGEGLSLTLLEAMAAGCAVVGYTGGGGREVMTDETATVVPDGSTLQLADALRAACDAFDTPNWSSYLHRAELAALLVKREYTDQHFRADLVAAIAELSSRRPSSPYSGAAKLDLGPLAGPSLLRRVAGRVLPHGRH